MILKGLPEKCLLACSLAVTKLNEVFQKLEKREITIEELEKIKKHLEKIERLCCAAKKEMETVILRLREFEAFQEKRRYLKNLCQEIAGENIAGNKNMLFYHCFTIVKCRFC